MSFPYPYPQAFMPSPFIDGDGGGWPLHSLDHSGFPVNHHERPDPITYSEQAQPLKRLRNLEDNSPSYGQFIPQINNRMNPSNPGGGRGISRLFYKTRMCINFRDGSCKNGANCTFAHGIEDVREPAPNWQEFVREKDGGNKSWNDDQRLIRKMKLCKKFYNGEECPYGKDCNFLHERPDSNFNSVSVDEWPRSRTDVPMQRESAAIGIGTRGSAIGNASAYDRPEIIKPVNPNSDALRSKTVYWKTKLCSKWETTGQCPFGERCSYAHGQSELHVPSAQVNADSRVNSSSILIKPVPVPVTDLSPANVEVGAQVKDTREDNNFLRWKLKRKINKIYGDWIDDQTPRHGSPNEVEDW